MAKKKLLSELKPGDVFSFSNFKGAPNFVYIGHDWAYRYEYLTLIDNAPFTTKCECQMDDTVYYKCTIFHPPY